MKTIEEIKKEINSLGIRRIKYELHPVDKAEENLKLIMSEMLKAKKEVLDWDNIKPIAMFIINWTYMIGDADFNKGFLLMGATGRGKTFLLNAWKYFLAIDDIKYVYNGKTVKLTTPVVNVKKIAGEYQDPVNGGYQVIEKYGNYRGLVLDDIGKEDEFSMNYGNKVNIIEEIINIREDLGLLTFGTTNTSQLSKLYDDRTVSRMNKLFTPIPVNHNKDFRV